MLCEVKIKAITIKPSNISIAPDINNLVINRLFKALKSSVETPMRNSPIILLPGLKTCTASKTLIESVSKIRQLIELLLIELVKNSESSMFSKSLNLPLAAIKPLESCKTAYINFESSVKFFNNAPNPIFLLKFRILSPSKTKTIAPLFSVANAVTYLN